MRYVFAVVFVLLWSVAASAQTTITRGPVPPGAKVAFETSVTTAAQALTFEARLSKNGTPLTAATQANGLTCALVNGAVTCQWPLSASNLDALNQVGVHSLTLTVFRADVGESQASAPFILTTPAAAPTGGRLIP